jgi:sec-independent protein translocase protein TatC
LTPDPTPLVSFWDHVEELRKRLIWGLAALGAGFALAYFFSRELFDWLAVPYVRAYRDVVGRQPELITTGLLESFLVYLKVGLVGGCFLASPVIFSQIWAFVSPGLRESERKHAIPFVLLASLFFLGGAAVGYFGVFPIGFKYFLELAPPESVQPMIRMQEYFQLAAWMLLIFGLVFEAPILVFYLAYLGVLRPRHLIRPWRAIVVGIAVASAVLTPADPVSMLLMMIPLLAFYGLIVVFALAVRRRV